MANWLHVMELHNAGFYGVGLQLQVELQSSKLQCDASLVFLLCPLYLLYIISLDNGYVWFCDLFKCIV